MGIKGIRTALKVDLNKPAREQLGLHVCAELPIFPFTQSYSTVR